MEVAPHARKRKACDLCSTKRIKCDGLKPNCSNCLLYGVECKITLPEKTSVSRVRDRDASMQKKGASARESSRIAQVESRLERMEAFMQMMARTGGAAQRKPTSSDMAPNTSPASMTRSNPDKPSPNSSSSGPVHTPPEFSGQDYHLAPVHQLYLPPLEEILPVIDNYFQHGNSLLPLFHRPSFMSMLYGWHALRSPAEWAAINIVMAMSYRIVDGLHVSDPRFTTCLKNAESQLMPMMMRFDDLLGLQVILGLVILHLGSAVSQTQRMTPMLMGSGTRLAQILKLNTRTAPGELSQALITHRRRVFWIAYILDRDTSQRYKLSPGLPDAEVEHPIPPTRVDDGEGEIPLPSPNGDITSTSISYLRFRVQLAHIQGLITDAVTSPRSRQSTPLDKAQSISQVETMLNHWYAALTLECPPETVLSSLRGPALHHMVALYCSHLRCLLILHDLHQKDAYMIARLRSSILGEGIDGKSPMSGVLDGRATSAILGSRTPLPVGWDACVVHSRTCVNLVNSTEPSEYFTWYNSCSHFAAGVILLTQLAEAPDHPLSAPDQRLVDGGLRVYDTLIAHWVEERDALRADFQSLNVRARAAVERSAEEGRIGRNAAPTGGLVGDLLLAGEEEDGFLGDLAAGPGLYGFEYDLGMEGGWIGGEGGLRGN